MTVAFGTFCVFVLLNFHRVNLFFNELTVRPDWQNMMMRFRTSGSGSLRLFVNLDYIKSTPLKIGAATAVGAVMGTLGGSLGRLTRGRSDTQANHGLQPTAACVVMKPPRLKPGR